jgi:hypothetical protein
VCVRLGNERSDSEDVVVERHDARLQPVTDPELLLREDTVEVGVLFTALPPVTGRLGNASLGCLLMRKPQCERRARRRAARLGVLVEARAEARARLRRGPARPRGDAGAPDVEVLARAACSRRFLVGRVAAPGRSSVSRVRENRTHGLKGESGNRSAYPALRHLPRRDSHPPA